MPRNNDNPLFDATLRVMEIDTSMLSDEALLDCVGKPIEEWPFKLLATLIAMHVDPMMIAHMTAHMLQKKEPECVAGTITLIRRGLEHAIVPPEHLRKGGNN